MSRDPLEVARRPYVPPATHALVATIVSVRMVLRTGGLAPSCLVLLSAPIVVALCAHVLARALDWHVSVGSEATLLLACMAVGMLLGEATIMRGEAFEQAIAATPVSAWTFRVASDPTQSNDSFRFRATASCEAQPSADVWITSTDLMERGQTFRCVGSYAPNKDDDWGVSSRIQGVWGSVRCVRVLESSDPKGLEGMVGSLRHSILQAIGPTNTPERALLAGCVAGYRGGLSSFGLDEVFSRCGLSHLIAVSGSHIAVLTGLLGVLLGATRMRPPLRAALTALASGCFVLLCGAPLSAIRSWVMSCTALLAGLAGRRSHSLSAVSVAGLVMVLVEPTVSGQVGYLLSVAAVGGLCLFSAYGGYVFQSLLDDGGRFARVLPYPVAKRFRHMRQWVAESLAVSCVAQLSTMPIIAQTFEEFSPWGPLAGIVVSFPLTLFVGLGLVALCLRRIPLVGHLSLFCCDLLAKLILGLCELFASMPFSTVRILDPTMASVVIWAALLILLLAWPQVSKRILRRLAAMAICLIMALHLRWRYFAPARICVLDIGQGDAILVQDGASAILVDAGPGSAVADALARNHVSHLDAVVITHLHNDHYGGLSELAEGTSCGKVIVAKGVAQHLEGELESTCQELASEGIEEVGYGDVLRVSGFTLRVVSPRQEVDGSENSHSLELVVSYDGDGGSLTALLTGDAEKDETGSVLAHGDVGDIDMLKVGHHGSEESLNLDQARALDPEVSVASAGEGNSYGHPTEACVQVLEEAGSEFYCTKDVGDVEVRPGKDGPLVKTQRSTA